MIIRVYDEIRQYPNAKEHPGAEPTVTERLVHEVKSDSAKVIAAFLRGVADERDPQDGKTYR